MNRDDITKELIANIVGLTVGNFRLVAGGTLILYVTRDGSLYPNVQISIRLWIESAWRICVQDSVVAGSLDDPVVLIPQLQKLIGMTICSVQLVGIPGDIILTLNSGVIIESFSRSVRDEQWQMRRDDGMRLGLRENFEFYMETVKPDEPNNT